MKKNIRKLLRPFANVIRLLVYNLEDTFTKIFGSQDQLMPPKAMNFVGNGDFKKTGQEFLRYFINFAGLKETDNVLDVGSGIGRMAIPLASYLKTGTYDGLDIVEKGVNWCNNKIAPKYPNFKFIHANVFNKEYNPNGIIIAADFKFPYADNHFDFVFLTSVFTHMLVNDMENYLSEIVRVLKPKGKCLISYFLINENSIKLIKNGKSTLDFDCNCGVYRIEDKNVPESAISYDEEFILRAFENNELQIISPIYYGSWCGRDVFTSYQDIIIAEKKSIC
ncbi:MAG: methylase involved in ubiquinone/menaquinone biosynthesis [Sphingobacteriales bacterium]|nr:methylase involved in ubiquinone/menaquinone biosynthesis [Sphingobacteriales bacterium]